MPTQHIQNLGIDLAADGKSVSPGQDFSGNLPSITLHASQERVMADLAHLRSLESIGSSSLCCCLTKRRSS